MASIALGDKEAAEDVHTGEDQGNEAEDLGPDRAVIQASAAETPTASKAPTTITEGDGIGHRHQRGMQGRCHGPDHVVADENSEGEHRNLENDRVDLAAGRGAGGCGDLVSVFWAASAALRATSARVRA